MVIAQRAFLCLVASATLAAAGCKLIAPYSQAKGQGVDPDGSVPLADVALDGRAMDGGLQGDSDSVSDRDSAVAEDAPLDSTPLLDIQALGDLPNWSDATTCAQPTAANAKLLADSELSANNASWSLSPTGDGDGVLHMGRNEWGRVWLAALFQVSVPAGSPQISSATLLMTPINTAPTYFDPLRICLEETFDAMALSVPQLPTLNYCRRWPESGDIFIDLNTIAIASPDIAPLIHLLVTERYGGAYPNNLKIQLWVGANEETGAPYTIRVRDDEATINTKLRLDVAWCPSS